MFARSVTLFCVFLTPLSLTAQPRLDARGLPLPEGALVRLGNSRFVAPEWINAVAISPDGKQIASAYSGITIWNADTAKIVRVIKAAELTNTLALRWSKNGRFLVAMTFGAEFSVWNVATGEPLWATKVRKPKSEKKVTAMQFVDNDRLLAIVLDDWCVELWNVEKGALVRTWDFDEKKHVQLKLLGNGFEFKCVSLSPSGEQMAWLASPDRAVKDGRSVVFLHETASGHLLRKVTALRATDRMELLDEGQTLVLHPSLGREHSKANVQTSHQYALVGIGDGRVHFHYHYSHHSRRSSAAPFGFVSRAGPSIAPRCLLNVRTALKYGQSLFTEDTMGLNGQQVDLGGYVDVVFRERPTQATMGMIRWDLHSGKKLDEWDEGFTDMAVSADGKRMVVGRGRRLGLCDSGLEPIRSNTDCWRVPSIHYLADGRLKSVSSDTHVGRFHIWDVRKGTMLESFTLRTHKLGTDRTPGDSDAWGRLFAYHVEDKSMAVHDLVTDKRLCLLNGLTVEDARQVYPILSDNSKRVLVCSRETDGILVLWFDSSSGLELGRYRIPRGKVSSTESWPVQWFSEDGTVFGYITPDNRLTLVDCASRKVCMTFGKAAQAIGGDIDEKLQCDDTWRYERTAFDKLIFASRICGVDTWRKEYVLWDRVSGQRIRRFCQPFELEDIASRYHCFSPDGRLLAVQHDSELTVYETATGRRLGRIPHSGEFHSYDIAPDGKTLATSCDDTTILIWDLNRPLAGKPDLPSPTTDEQASQLWQLLGDPDPQAAEPAIWALVRTPEQSLAILKKRLQPAPALETKRLPSLIAQLDSADYKQRDAAFRELTRGEEWAVPALRTTLKKGAASLEQRRRISELLMRLEDPGAIPSCLAELRALEGLERIGSADARRLVEVVAAGEATALLTREARLVLARWR